MECVKMVMIKRGRVKLTQKPSKTSYVMSDYYHLSGVERWERGRGPYFGIDLATLASYQSGGGIRSRYMANISHYSSRGNRGTV